MALEMTVASVARVKTFSRDTRVSLFDCHTIETVVPKKLEFPQEADARRILKPGTREWGGGFVSQKEISHSCDNLSDHLAGETGAKTTVCQ